MLQNCSLLSARLSSNPSNNLRDPVMILESFKKNLSFDNRCNRVQARNGLEPCAFAFPLCARLKGIFKAVGILSNT